MNIKIREANINDYEGLCEIYAELDTFHRLNHPELFVKPEDYSGIRGRISEIIADNDKALFVATAEAEVVGFAECYVQKSADFPAVKRREWIQLDGIAVKEGYQNYHIGSLLLEKIVEWAKGKGMERIELKVYSFNKNAIEFYLRKGFMDLNRTMYLNL